MRKSKKTNSDEILENADLSDAIKNGKVLKAKGRPKIGRKISLTLPEELIQKLSKNGEKKGIGYQTYIRMILLEAMENEEKSA